MTKSAHLAKAGEKKRIKRTSWKEMEPLDGRKRKTHGGERVAPKPANAEWMRVKPLIDRSFGTFNEIKKLVKEGTRLVSKKRFEKNKVSISDVNRAVANFRAAIKLGVDEETKGKLWELENRAFMRLAIQESRIGSMKPRKEDGGPFGAVIVLRGKVIATSHNLVTSTHNNASHAEMVAIEKAGKSLEQVDLSNCVLYTSCEPCHMCFGNITWSNIKTVYLAATTSDASDIAHFRDDMTGLLEIKWSYVGPDRKTIGLKKADGEPYDLTYWFMPDLRGEAQKVMKDWVKRPGREQY